MTACWPNRHRGVRNAVVVYRGRPVNWPAHGKPRTSATWRFAVKNTLKSQVIATDTNSNSRTTGSRGTHAPAAALTDSVGRPKRSSIMRRLLLLGAVFALTALNTGCFLNMYSSDPNERMRQELNQSENLRQLRKEWERFWMIDQPSHLSPDRVHGGIGPGY
jgi:hypothetical protein